MTVSTASPLSVVAASSPATADGADDFRLDVRIVEYGPVAAALLGDTDDGCDTVRGGDC